MSRSFGLYLVFHLARRSHGQFSQVGFRQVAAAAYFGCFCLGSAGLQAALTQSRMNRRKADFQFHYKFLEDES